LTHNTAVELADRARSELRCKSGWVNGLHSNSEVFKECR